MKIVLDANCAIEIALNKKEGDRLKALLDESDAVLAPDLLFPEFVNTLWNTISSNNSVWAFATKRCMCSSD
ncbi:MAG: hypothetical protein ABI833_03980 [Acidobacteriota bacterium]